VGDDPILESWPAMLDTTGIVTVASSIAAARAMLTAAETEGHTISADTPVYFNIGGQMYIADGTKTDGVWYLRLVNEPERDQLSTSTGETYTVNGSTYQNLLNGTIPARPYDRLFLAFGQANGQVTAGRVQLVARVAGVLGSRSAFGSDEMATQTSICMSVVTAGTDPDLHLSLIAGGGGTGTINIVGDTSARLCRFNVIAFPISMA
jgi:hypothetical protein